MGHSVSAVKRERQNAVRQARNKANRGVLKKQLRLFEKTAQQDPAQAAQMLAQVHSALDRAARKNAIPKGRADRKKARLALMVRRLQAQGAPAPAAPTT